LFALLVPMIAVALFESGARAADDDPVLIIANNSLPISSISLVEVKRVFRKEATTVNGVRVVPINASRNNPLRSAFVQKAFGATVQEDISNWEKLKVMSGLQPPTEMDNTLKAVFSVKNGISYCFKSEYRPGTAKILLTL
jgi:hypothetical protein